MRSASFCKWRSKYGGMDAALMTRMKELEAENARLKKMYAEELLTAEVVREAIEKSGETGSPTRDGPTSGTRARDERTPSLPGIRH